MKTNSGNLLRAVALVCAILLTVSASAQRFSRYVSPSDIGSKSLLSGTVLTSVTLPQGVARVDNNSVMRDAAFELMDILRNQDTKLLSVYVCGSASPDGLWQDNVNLSAARTRNAANYLRHVTGIPVEMIHQESLNEDWDRLYELVEASNMPYRSEVLSIIRNTNWGERKRLLQSLDYGRVWRILLDDFFPQLRCVRIGFFHLDDSTAITAKEAVDTVYVRDTVYFAKETVFIPETSKDAVKKERRGKKDVTYDTPWMMGFKTNLLSDVLLVPDLGFEVQLGKQLSLNLNGWYTNINIFSGGGYTDFYGFSPELRWWFGDHIMQKGHFIGLHANLAWYTLEWKKADGSSVLYQNGTEENYSDPSAGLGTPAWSAGLTYGYSLGLGRKANWGLEFYVGLGYIRTVQNLGTWSETPTPGWYFAGNERNSTFGVTKAGVNLTYRFSLRKAAPEYYESLNATRRRR